MKVFTYSSFDEAKTNMLKVLDALEKGTDLEEVGHGDYIFQVTSQNKKVPVGKISLIPDEISDLFYRPLFRAEGDYDLKTETKTVADHHTIRSDFFDRFKIAFLTVKSKLKRNQISVDEAVGSEFKSYKELTEYVSSLFEKYGEDSMFFCDFSCYMGKHEFSGSVIYDVPSTGVTVDLVVSTKEQPIKSHLAYRNYMTAVNLCKFLVYYNVSEVYDGFLGKGFKTEDSAFLSFESVDVEFSAYRCKANSDKYDSIYVEIIRGMLTRDISQYVFMDNDFVRENIEKAVFVDSNFVGLLKEAHKDILKIVRETDIDSELKKFLMGRSLDRLNAVFQLEPAKTTKNGKEYFLYQIGENMLCMISTKYREDLNKIREKYAETGSLQRLQSSKVRRTKNPR